MVGPVSEPHTAPDSSPSSRGPEALLKMEEASPFSLLYWAQMCILSPVSQHFLVSSAATDVLNILALKQHHYCRSQDGRSEWEGFPEAAHHPPQQEGGAQAQRGQVRSPLEYFFLKIASTFPIVKFQVHVQPWAWLQGPSWGSRWKLHRQKVSLHWKGEFRLLAVHGVYWIWCFNIINISSVQCCFVGDEWDLFYAWWWGGDNNLYELGLFD